MENEQKPPEPPSHPQEQPVSIQDEMRTSYLDYAMSVIIGRAIPDVREWLATQRESAPGRAASGE